MVLSLAEKADSWEAFRNTRRISAATSTALTMAMVVVARHRRSVQK